MAKGAVAKQEIFDKMLKTFGGSFMYNGGKELRIPWNENGVDVQIKVALTCAKDNVFAPGMHGDPVGEPGERGIENAATAQEAGQFMNFPEPHKKAQITEEEKKNVEDLMKALGLD